MRTRKTKCTGETVTLGASEFLISPDGATFEHVRNLRDEEIKEFDPFDVESAALADRLGRLKPKDTQAKNYLGYAIDQALGAGYVENNRDEFFCCYTFDFTAELLEALDPYDTNECVTLIAEIIRLHAVYQHSRYSLSDSERATSSWIHWLYCVAPDREGEGIRFYGKVFADALARMYFWGVADYMERRKKVIACLREISARDWSRKPARADAERQEAATPADDSANGKEAAV